jgi:hypothetical protein
MWLVIVGAGETNERRERVQGTENGKRSGNEGCVGELPFGVGEEGKEGTISKPT